MNNTFKNLLVVGLLCLPLAVGAHNSGYHVSKSLPIKGAGGWDYVAVSPVHDWVYVAHGMQVNILDKNTGDSVGVIANTPGVHGIAFDTKHGKGFTSNGRANTLTVFDINTNTVTGEIKVGENPDAIMFDDASGYVYVCNGRSNDISVVDPAETKVVKTIPVGGKPETAVTDGAGMLFVNVEDKNEVVAVSLANFEVKAHYKIGKGDEPSGLAVDTKTKRLFVGCGNKELVILNSANGDVVKELPIGDGCDGVVFDPETRLVFSSNGEGTLTVIHEKGADVFEKPENVTTQKSARTLALDPKTHKIYLPAAEMRPNEDPKKRPTMVPGTFKILIVEK